MAKTGQSHDSIMKSYKTFSGECQGGVMTKEQFVKLSKVYTVLFSFIITGFSECKGGTWRGG